MFCHVGFIGGGRESVIPPVNYKYNAGADFHNYQITNLTLGPEGERGERGGAKRQSKVEERGRGSSFFF